MIPVEKIERKGEKYVISSRIVWNARYVYYSDGSGVREIYTHYTDHGTPSLRVERKKTFWEKVESFYFDHWFFHYLFRFLVSAAILVFIVVFIVSLLSNG